MVAGPLQVGNEIVGRVRIFLPKTGADEVAIYRRSGFSREDAIVLRLTNGLHKYIHKSFRHDLSDRLLLFVTTDSF
jgi:hypothetical protein